MHSARVIAAWRGLSMTVRARAAAGRWLPTPQASVVGDVMAR